MLTLAEKYRPVTAYPNEKNSAYSEIPPCSALKQVIRCFWGNDLTVSGVCIDEMPPRLIIPDTCTDIIFRIDRRSNTAYGRFHAIDEKPYFADSTPDPDVSTFGIRFYPWAAALFSENSLEGCKNQSFDLEKHFSWLNRELTPVLISVGTFAERVQAAEKNVLSERQLERRFGKNIGISPKSFSSLVRYQFLWQEICLRPNFSVLDAVVRYGYTDQSHLLHDFKRRHLMTPIEAAAYSKSRTGDMTVS